MSIDLGELLAEQRRGLAAMMKNLRRSRAAAVREAARSSAARIRALNEQVRALARSGVRLSTASHTAAQRLIELQAEIVDSALTEASAKVTQLAYTESLRDLQRLQSEVLQATRERIVADLARATTILQGAASAARRATPPEAPAAGSAPRRRAVAAGRGKAKAKAKRKPRARGGRARRPPARR